MKLSKKEDIKKFLSLVSGGAPTKAYRVLGLNGDGIKYHLQFIPEYEKILIEPVVVKESKKVESTLKVSTRGKENKNENTDRTPRDIFLRDTEEL